MLKQKIMVVVSVLMGSLLMACSTMTKAEREAKEAEQAKMVKEALDKRHYKIDINMMYARRFGSKNVTSNWSLEVKGDTLVSYLPYIGVAYEASFGSNSGLNFTAPISNYEDEGFRKDCIIVLSLLTARIRRNSSVYCSIQNITDTVSSNA